MKAQSQTGARAVGVTLTALLIATVLGEASGASAATGSTQATPQDRDVRVQVGAAPPGGAPLPFSYTRYYPEQVKVHRGQTVVFDTVEPFDLHTTSFWPGGAAALPPLFRPNEEPESFAVNEPAWQRSSCGDVSEPACRVDGSTKPLSSGLNALTEPTWRVTVDRPVGSTTKFLCMVHPGMSGSIKVVPDSVPLPTQAEIDAQTREQVAADTEEAIAHRALRDRQVVRRPDGDRDIWRVLVGDSSPSGHVSIMSYMPNRLTQARPGDAVEFVAAGVSHHSATFPTALVGYKKVGGTPGLALGGLHPACDFDELDRGAPGLAMAWAPFSPLECPAAFELVVSPWVASPTRAPRDEVLTPTAYHDSGLMWSDQMPEYARGRPAGSGDYFPHRFLAEFPVSGKFSYACTIHGAERMDGTIQVGA